MLVYSTWNNHYVKLKYLLKCMLVTVLTPRNENYFQILKMTFFLQIIFKNLCTVSCIELF